MTTAEATTNGGTSVATSMTMSTVDTTTNGEITTAIPTTVTTTSSKTDGGMYNTTMTPMITMYSSTPYNPGPIDCGINNGNCEEECIREVNGNDR